MAANHYIKIPAIYKKLKMAEAEGRVIYIHAPVGYGKTAAIHYYYRRKKYRYLSGEDGYLKDKPDMAHILEDTVVIDDLSWITEPESQEYIKTLIKTHTKHVVLAGRSHVPSWLNKSYVEEQFLLVGVQELLLTNDNTKKLMEMHGLEATEEEIQEITENCGGNGLCINLICYRMQDLPKGEQYGEKVRRAAQVDMFHYFEHAFFEKWTPEICTLLLSVAGHPQFDKKMAEMLTGDSRIAAHIEQMQAVGDFIYVKDAGVYQINPVLNNFLLWKQSITWSEKKIQENHERAGLYYELQERTEDALEQYYFSGEGNEHILRVLTANAKKQVGTAHLYELRKYYMALPEKEILKQPILIAGLAMLCSIMLQPEKSEEWYGKLAQYEKSWPRGSRERREAKSHLAYLDIALPHRGITRIIDIMKNVATLCVSREVKLPEFSVTSNLPSTMNGGKDFCEWSRNDRELAKVMKQPVELIMGSFGAGLVNTALAESLFEKGSKDDYELLTLLNAGYTQAEMQGKIEMCFAASAILAQMHLRHNQPDVAVKLIHDLEQKAMKENAYQLIPNIHAFKAWLAMECGRTEGVAQWLAEAPNENQEFYILDRYRYLIKFRAYLLFGRYEEAWNLSERLQFYFTRYGRKYMEMENLYLRAVLHYRQKNEKWKETLMQALKYTEEYHFTWIPAKEGTAILPLMEESKEDAFFQTDYGHEVMSSVKQMACSYPAYLMERKVLEEPLTEMEEKILRMHCAGLQTTEIVERLSIQESTLKFHNTNIFRKLGVRNRQEAVYVAKSSGLIQMGGNL